MSTPAIRIVGAPAAAPADRRIGVGTKLAYGFGSIAYGIKDNGFSTLLLLFYNQVVGLRADLVGLAIMVALVADAFVDPLIGHLSDHCRSRWGRRHPFMYAAAIPVGVLYLLLWIPPRGSPTETLVYLAAVAIAVRTSISCYEVPSSALAPELTTDYHERTSVLGYRFVFGWIGGMGMSLLTFLVLLAPTRLYPVGQLNPEGYRHYAVIAAAAMTTAILVSSFATHREIAYLPTASPTRTSLKATFAGIALTLRNRAFLMLLLAGMAGLTAQGLTFALSTYMFTYFWKLPATALGLYTLVVLAGVLLAFAIASRASRGWGKKQTAAAASVIYPLVAVLPLGLRMLGLFPADGSPLLLPLLMLITVVATGFGVAVSILAASMMSDVVEDGQMRTGARSEGLFFAGSFFMQKCVSGLGLFLSGLILSLVHFPANAAPGRVPAPVIDQLVLIYGGALLGLSLVAASFYARFPLGGQRDHENRLARLAEVASHAAPLPGAEPELAPISPEGRP